LFTNTLVQQKCFTRIDVQWSGTQIPLEMSKDPSFCDVDIEVVTIESLDRKRILEVLA
jgi:hypothetical protein